MLWQGSGRTRKEDTMANIVKSNELQSSELDPFRMLREWMRWDPFRAIAPVFGRSEREWTPSFEVRENDESYLFKADLPGLKQDDLDVTLAGNRLQIAGKRDAEHETKEDKVYIYERTFGSFLRTFTLPDDIDVEHVRSELKDGVLTVVVPKTVAAKPKKIQISTGTTKS